MSGMAAFYAAVSGVKGQLFSMSIVGNNISNTNTHGFKTGRVTFRESLVQTLRGPSAPRENFGGQSALQVGLGMQVGSVDVDRTQGMLQQTGIVTDLAVDGDGYFILSDGQTDYFTRAGNFVFDANGNLTSPGNGLIVQGWLADDSGNIPTGAPLEHLTLPFGETSPARASTQVDFSANLDAGASDSVAELTSAGTTGISAVSGTAADGAGGVHTITVLGANATQSTNTGTNAASVVLTGNETLTSLGVTDASTLTITVDGGETYDVLGLTIDSTVGELVQAINNLGAGVTAEIDGGEVKLTRNYYGVGTIYNIETNVGVAGDIAAEIFGATGSSFSADNGTASTLTATDSFTPTGRAAMAAENLTLAYDSNTGLVTGITELADGGISIIAESGLAAGTAAIGTEDTQHLTSILVYDTLGVKHTLNMTFTKSATQNKWYWETSFEDNEIIMGGRTGTIEFNSNGSFRTFSFDDGSEYFSFAPETGADNLRVSFNTGNSNSFSGLTQFSSPFTAKAIGQDGYGMGNLSEITVDTSGKITGLFTNGVLRNMGQVVLSTFKNPDGLTRIGGNLYQVSPNSGHSITGAAGTTIDASIVSKSLEMSNVDLAEEFTRMITAQRGFQANARVITSGDEILMDLMNLKR
ncbi:MAG: flagellar hook-basal body complex protein [Candidatus Eisenbacteria bacterium]